MKSSKVTQNSGFVFLLCILVAVVITRVYGLTFKPIHFDESINAWFSSQVREHGFYRYDPNNYHGPLYFYILRFLEIIFGSSLITLRAVPTLFSVASIAIFALPLAGTRQWRLWAAGLLLISPAFVFFGRSAIHEMPFVFFQIIFGLGVLRSLEKKDEWVWACFLIGLFGMTTLKETFAVTCFSFVVSLFALGPAGIKSWFHFSSWKNAWNRRLTILLLLLLWFFVNLYSGFFKNMAGLLDFFRAFIPWMKTGVHGSGHDKEFLYWTYTLAKAEPLALLGVVMAFAGLFSQHRALRVLSLFSLTQFLVYSAIPYKTVWCILTIVWGFYLVLAFFAATVKPGIKRYVFFAALGIAGILNLRSLYTSSYQYPIDLKHPYVYVNSTYQLTELDSFLAQHKLQVQIGMEEQWPWPWLLRDQKIASYDVCGKKTTPQLDVYFCDPKDMAAIETSFAEAYWKISFEFRSDRGPSLVYLKKSLFPEIPFSQTEVVGGEL